MIARMVLLCMTFPLAGVVYGQELETTPDRKNDIMGRHSLTLPAPVNRWDCALPLGNGITGGLLWGKGNDLRLSLDRGDLWDERGPEAAYDPKRNFETLKGCAHRGGRSTFRGLFMNVYEGKWTKLPGGRLNVKLPQGRDMETFHLQFERATGEVKLADESRVEVFFSATERVALLKLPKGSTFELIRPAVLDQLGYSKPVFSRTDMEISYVQKTEEKLVYAVACRWKDKGDHTLAILAITSNNEAKDPLKLAYQRIEDGFKIGWDSLHEAHLKWWKGFYNTSSVDVPNQRIQYHYNLAKYLYGSGSRSFAPPMPLQGVWTADGGLPPWKGDYHNDLNTQMTYVAWQAAGLVESGMSYINFYWNLLPEFRKYAKQFYGIEGAVVPGVMSLKAQNMGGWPQYAYMMTAGIWNGHAFYMHWKTTQDRKFLEERAYPWITEITESVLKLAEEKDGQIKIPLSVSPEWGSEKWHAYVKPNSNFDQALLIWVTEALAEMAEELGKKKDVEKWRAVRKKVGPLIHDRETGELYIAEGVRATSSHRHHSHTLAIHPLDVLTVHQSKEARKQVIASVRQVIDTKPSQWVGYSYTWAAALAARAGFPDDSVTCMLEFDRCRVTRNGFHVNSNQMDPRGRTRWRAFTLEGNFMLMDAVHEMSMQSFGGILQIFPAMPDSWQTASFRDLRAEGGFRVSARREGGRTEEVRITPVRDSVLKMKDPFGSVKTRWNVQFEKEDDCLVFKLKAGEELRGQRN